MSDKLCNGDWSRRLKVEIFDYNDSGEHDFIGQYYTNLEEMAEGEGFQIVTWDVINEKKKLKKGGEYENSGTVILKSISIDRVSSNAYFLHQQLLIVKKLKETVCKNILCVSLGRSFKRGKF